MYLPDLHNESFLYNFFKHCRLTEQLITPVCLQLLSHPSPQQLQPQLLLLLQPPQLQLRPHQHHMNALVASQLEIGGKE